MYARFNFLTHDPPSETDQIKFKPVLKFEDDELDVAVLELEEPHNFPEKFSVFSGPAANDKVFLIGHPHGERMMLNTMDASYDMTMEKYGVLKEASIKHCSKEYDLPHPNTLTNLDRYLLNCKFTKGASGAPGVVVQEDGTVIVVTMLLRGYPDWYYDPDLPEELRISWPQDFCIEQGANMNSVYFKMKEREPELCTDIFRIEK